MVKMLDLKKQYISIKDEIDDAIASVIADSAFVSGKYVSKFESEFADYVGVEYCVGVGNGTDAIEIALEAANLPKGSEVIVPGNSFIASSEAVSRSGLRVVFCDVDPKTYIICGKSLRDKITSNTSAIIAVHLYGHPCDMDDILGVAKEHDLFVIEDCAQAHGATFKGSPVGSIGDIGTFSFYPGKNLGAYGDAGAITTNNKKLSIKARMIANHGRVKKYDHEFEGRNSRLDGLQAAILSVKLKHIRDWTTRRVEVADFYLSNLKDIGDLILPERKAWAYQVYHLFVVRTSQQVELKKFLVENGISVGNHYPIALPKLDAYKYLDQGCEKTNYNDHDKDLLSLPIGEHMTDEDLNYVVTKIKEFYSTL